MLEISTTKIAHVIVKAREYDAKTGSWEDALASGFHDNDSNSILENFSDDATGSELAEFITTLNDDEQASLVALTWVGRGTYAPEELTEAIGTAKSEKVNQTSTYLMGIPLLADYLEDGLDKLGYSVDDIEAEIQ